MIRHKKIVDTETNDGKAIKLALLKPSVRLDSESRKIYNKAWNEGRLDGGYFPQANIYKVARDLGLWGDEQETKLTELDNRIVANLETLKNGGIPLWGFREGAAQYTAIQVVKDRMERLRLFSGINSLYEHTIESYSETLKYNFLLSNITVYHEDLKPFYLSVDDYIARSEEKSSIDVTEAAQDWLYPQVSVADQQRELPEIKFMLKYKMITDELKLIDRNGQNINLNGDVLEDVVAAVDVKQSPFLNEDGSPIIEEISGENSNGADPDCEATAEQSV